MMHNALTAAYYLIADSPICDHRSIAEQNGPRILHFESENNALSVKIEREVKVFSLERDED
jgi:hypothetical protein